jgi:rhombotail lipoprotein
MRHIRMIGGSLLVVCLTGCAALFHDFERRHHGASSPLVEFLYGHGEVPPVASEVHLELPIRVGVSFLPASGRAGPSAVEREKVLAAIRDNFKSRPYVTEIVPIPDYYLRANGNDGLTQIQQVSRLNQLDLFALVSYDQVTDLTVNKNSLAYLTIVGAFIVRGDRHETHTLLDLAVVDPRTRTLVLRSGGTSSLAGNTTLIEAEHHETAQRAKGFELATTSLVDNFKRELTDFEGRVREGTAPVRVTRRTFAGGSGGGALDPALLLFLIALLGTGACRARARLLSSRRIKVV